MGPARGNESLCRLPTAGGRKTGRSSRRFFDPNIFAHRAGGSLPIADTIAQQIQHRRAEAAIRAAKAEAEAAALAVAESAERFRLLAEVVSMQVWMAGADGELSFANAECAEYFDAEMEEILETRWTQSVHPEDLPAAALSGESRSQPGSATRWSFGCVIRGDEYRWFLVRAEAMRDAEGRVDQWFGTNTDIDDLKKAQRKLTVQTAPKTTSSPSFPTNSAPRSRRC